MTESNQSVSASERPLLGREFIDAVPHSRLLGMSLTDLGKGTATLEMPYNEKLIGDPESGVIHGGAVFALMDTCCGVAVLSHPIGPFATATLDLRIDYMRSATPGQKIVATAECYHATRTVAFVRATATDEDTSRPVATATGTFALEHKKETKS